VGSFCCFPLFALSLHGRNQKVTMDEEKRAAKRLFAGEKKPSMKRREDHNDYADRHAVSTDEPDGYRAGRATAKRGDETRCRPAAAAKTKKMTEIFGEKRKNI